VFDDVSIFCVTEVTTSKQQLLPKGFSCKNDRQQIVSGDEET
jgi:hypothetical protein